MGELTDPRLIWLKGGLFLVLGLLCAGVLLADAGNVRSALLLLITVWSFCRFYYFAFYVIEHYVDAEYRFTGLCDFALYAAGLKRRG